jgi:5-formyltetrahydrofolate cyclo-ligase
MTDLVEAKRAARAAGAAARGKAHAAAAADAAERLAESALAAAGLDRARTASGYLPIRTEIDPRPLMGALHVRGLTVCVPVIEAPGLPLKFRAWSPGVALVRGPFDVAVPAEGAWVVPDLLFVPLLGFDAAGYRLGYGGGFYDRTLAALRTHGRVRAIGLAYAAQRFDRVPRDATDARLDAIATEDGLIVPA